MSTPELLLVAKHYHFIKLAKVISSNLLHMCTVYYVQGTVHHLYRPLNAVQ